MDSSALINQIKKWLHLKSAASAAALTPPSMPAEIFTADQMERHGVTVALSHELAIKYKPNILLQRLKQSETQLINTYQILNEKNKINSSFFSPAREWLLDNFYLIQEQIDTIRRNLPKGYGKTLPQLAGDLPGYPRIYDIALEIIEHGDGRWDLENLKRFFIAYQSVSSLTLGELWATPITLSIAMIENLSRASAHIVTDRDDRNLANHWADRMIDVAVSEPKNLVLAIADMARSEPHMSSAFVAELARRLQGAALGLALSWIEQHLAEEGLSIEELVQAENKQQAANQVTISNCIAGLRRLNEIDWRDFVEKMSVVEERLLMDPSCTYQNMDFGTRDHYRHVIEDLARASGQPEEAVADAAIMLADEYTRKLNSGADLEMFPECHVGFYLISKGFPQLNQTLGIQLTDWQKLVDFVKDNIFACYLFSILFITAGILYVFLSKAYHSGITTAWILFLGIVVTLCASQLALSIVNLISTLLVKPEPLPRMDFSKGIPAAYRSMVVVPAMLGSIKGIESLLEALEIRFLGNSDPHLYFALLTDFNDAPHADMPEDAALLQAAEQGIQALNAQYAKDNQDIFFLFHRARQWNESEQRWMGKERKRGKLSDLNNLLRKNIQSGFSKIIGSTSLLNQIIYVITLDCDTQLPRESARQYVATMVHPLNRPQYNTEKQRVVEGYGILQPRVAEALPNTSLSPYVWLCTNEFGIDPYTRTVSDVYQDLFHEGSFIGKGIYDVDLFQKVLGDRFPDNRILSHDLLEGCYLRSGFLSDVPLYETAPSNYLLDTKRRIRWIRGDWQIAAWILPWVPGVDQVSVPNPLSSLSKLKIFDNLRRSLVPPALLVLLAINWIILPETTFWLSFILAIVILPLIVNALIELFRKPKDALPMQHIINILPSLKRQTMQLILFLSCIPHEAWYSLSAILRTCYRMLISKRHLLEWTASDQIVHRQDTKSGWLVCMWMGPLIAIIAGLSLIMQHKFESLWFAMPLLALWLASPFITFWLSQPLKVDKAKLSSAQLRFLHRMARKTWGFFETFMTADNHWLPPDNFQETPLETIARRSSPTNMGLALLANLSAYDFGYITISQLLERCQKTLHGMSQLERFRGHLYNWYNISTLEPLHPRYVSTVDSGNLAGHLLTLRQGLLALKETPILSKHYLDGLFDTWEILSTLFTQPLPLALTHFQVQLNNARSRWSNGIDALACCHELCSTAAKITVLTVHDKSSNEIVEWSTKLLDACHAIRDEIAILSDNQALTKTTRLCDIIQTTSKAASYHASTMSASIDKLADIAFSLSQIDVSFLYDHTSHLMSIGFNVDEQRRDHSNYDLLSSEARLGNFVAIAQGQVLQESWFALGRLLVAPAGEPILVSWSGSMFEYLMPVLIMPSYPGTLLDQSCRSAVRRQIAYGKLQGVPWGISESGFNAVDAQFNYLYRAFGVPGLGLKRGLEEDLVIAPYASAMALMIDPEMACLNLQRLAAEYAEGKYGFYEAIDFTPSRLPRDTKRALVRSFMTHHQGMTLLAFSYYLHDQPMQKRFIADPLFQATLLLLQERRPKANAAYLQIPKSPKGSTVYSQPEASTRIFNTPNTRSPQVQLLSNGRYHLVLTQAGGSYSRWQDIALTRWREDSTCDNWGSFSYISDVTTGEFCSPYYQPTKGAVENYKVIFSEAHVEFFRTAMLLDMHTEVVVSPEDDIELRRLRIYNRSKTSRTIEFTSYAEIVLAPQATDQSQPAFINLFIETEINTAQQAIIVKRRPLNAEQKPPFLSHILKVYSKQPYTLSYETDRARFLGRGRSLAQPNAMLHQGGLSNTQGAVLDAIVAIRARITIEADAHVTFDLLTGVSDTYEHCLSLIERYQDHRLANRIFGLAWTHAQVLLHQLNITEADAQLYEKMASAIIYTSSSRRADPRLLITNRRRQSGLWSYSISGDLPIVLLHIENADNIDLVKHLIKAQAYWRRKGLVVDLVILNEEPISYRQALQDLIMGLITTNVTADHKGTIVVRPAEQLPLEDSILLQSAAKIVFSDKRGSLSEQLSRRRISPPPMPILNVTQFLHKSVSQNLPPLPYDLQFFNGFGGFTKTGNEYIIRLSEGARSPAPWSNIIANPYFGTLLSESGQGYTWSENAHEFRLTPWENDHLRDTGGETFYLRNEMTGHVWSPTALPCPGLNDYQTRHGFGYSVFEHIEEDIYTELSIFVAPDAPIKFALLKIRNDSKQNHILSATGFVAWVLGDLRTKNAMHVVTELSESGTIIAYNHYNNEFGDRIAFFDAVTSNINLNSRSITGDRNEFIGRNGSLRKPVALLRKRLSGRVGAGLDPCAAIQLNFDLAKGQTREIVFSLGAGKNKQEVEDLIQRHHGSTAAKDVLEEVRQYWQKTLHMIQVATPDPALNILANGWLLYQVISSRLWGRTGYYQSSGAFGFRDQLQDVMSLAQVAPQKFREHILLCAAHQFEAGDVQHWWHPPQNRGLRTRCSDDFLWLPFALCHYIETTGDMTILNETTPFLQGRLLNIDETAYYDVSMPGSETANVYQHAVRAIKNGLKFGAHGLPLIGSGDWNDGMDLVGHEGKGESVWLGFFLYAVLKRFSVLAKRFNDLPFAELCDTESSKLQKQIEAQGWDGEWYLRAYFDDGSPLGSAKNQECRIDSIAQSWSVLSGAAEPQRAKQAMQSLKAHLVDNQASIIKLLDPPFDKSTPSPGYIQGYVPGIRENGGQYTHAGIWAAMAFAQLNEKELAWEMFNILNPINHGRSYEEIMLYKIEPYVVAGDVYSVAPHTGRGGWSWYTGSAGWLYRLITETLLGLRLEGGHQLHLEPMLPDNWEGFSVEYRHRSTLYKITIKRVSDQVGLWVDDIKLPENVISLQDDGQTHQVTFKIKPVHQ